MGAIEVEYEGSDDFLKKELPELLAAVSSLHKEAGARMLPAAYVSPSGSGGGGEITNLGTISGTTATIAAKLGCDSGPELILAAAAQLTFVGGKDRFTAKELRNSCREARSLWKRSYGNNFGKYVATLVKDQSLLEAQNGVYALQAKKKQALEAQLVTA